jgi:secreted PhoX family phosphatase
VKNSFNPTRRSLLKSSAAAAAVPLVGSLQALAVRRAQAAGQVTPVASPYGPIRAVKDHATELPLLQLPAGFNYKSFSWTGDPMENGQPVPGSHDGMAVVAVRKHQGSPEIVLVRNHERGMTSSIIDASGKYDTIASSSRAGGGTTNLYYRSGIGQPVKTLPSLGGTLVNCAGGATPWGTWLTCEETMQDLTSAGGRKHGYVFEVTADPAHTTGQPIVGMGRFSHEAAAVDPATGIVYLTQDDRNKSALYRYIPFNKNMAPGSLAAGGQLQAAKVQGVSNASWLTPSLGDRYELEWVDIPEPDADPQDVFIPDASGSVAGPFIQAWAAGAARMSRGEGIWYHKGKMYIVDTSTGRDSGGRPGRGEGCVWMLDLATQKMTAIFVSDNAVAGNNPDNITVSPRGGILLCEDGGGVADAFGFGDRLMGLTPLGESFIFAKNNINLTPDQLAAAGKNVDAGDYRDNEFCGACFDPSGHTLFVNIQTPGITFAIWGPWSRGTL